MALEQYCGLSKMPFMQDDMNSEFAKRDLKIACSIFTNPYRLLAPPFINPKENLNKILQQNHMKLDVAHGTTTLGFKYQGGIVLCADSRSTLGNFINSQEVKKILVLDKCMLGTTAGGAADCMYWDRVLTMECRLHRLQTNQSMTVTAASHLICNIANSFKGMGLSMGMMLAGYDHERPRLIYVDSEGTRTDGNIFSVGSGSVNAIGVLDTGYHHNLTDEEAYNLALRSIYHATFLDTFSGGLVRLYHVKKSGWILVCCSDCMQLHEKFSKELSRAGRRQSTEGEVLRG